MHRTAVLAIMLTALLAGCIVNANKAERVEPTTSAVLTAQNAGVVVAELFVSKVYCFHGSIALGTEDGTKITDYIRMGRVRKGWPVEFASRSLPAGRYHILFLGCEGGNTVKFARYRRKPGLLTKPIYEPMGSFSVNPGEVVYIGSLHATAIPKWFTILKPATVSIEDSSARVRQKLSEAAPDLAKAMVVRLAEGLPSQ